MPSWMLEEGKRRIYFDNHNCECFLGSEIPFRHSLIKSD